MPESTSKPSPMPVDYPTDERMNILESVIETGLTFPGLARLLVEWTLSYLPAPRCVLSLKDPRGPTLHVEGVLEDDGIVIRERNGSEPFVPGSGADPPLEAEPAQRQAEGQAHLETGILHGEQVLGRIRVFPHAEDQFAEGDIETLNKLGQHFGFLLHHRSLMEEAQNLAVRDELTGLYNRRHLRQALERELPRAQQEGRPLSLFLLDVDHFKSFNDTWGHSTGDRVLVLLANLMGSIFRQQDIVSRYGGEEFAVLLCDDRAQPCQDHPTEVYEFAERLRLEAGELKLTSEDGRALSRITISGGIATFPRDASTAEELVEKADEALYRAKRSGRNRIYLASLIQPAVLDLVDPPDADQRPGEPAPAPASASAFAQVVTAAGIMSEEELSQFQEILPQPPTDGQMLAQALIEAGKLTAYQASILWQGKTKALWLGEYLILDKIAEGGMGRVFKARHQPTGRLVAAKVLPPEAAEFPDRMRRFQREIRMASRLSHPNIVATLDAGEADTVCFIVMELIDGNDLSHLVRKHGPLACEHAIDFVIQAARGLQYLHESNIHHRDIKPANLIVDTSGAVKVLDLGLARSDSSGMTTGNLTMVGSIMGTIEFSSPEQLEDTHGVDHRSDIYSLGCSLFFLLTGRLPYKRKTPVECMLAHQQDPVPSARAVRPEVPRSLDRIVQKMMAKDPDERYQTMNEVIESLQTGLAKVNRRRHPQNGADGSAWKEIMAALRRDPRDEAAIFTKTVVLGANPSIEQELRYLVRQTEAVEPSPARSPIAKPLKAMMAVTTVAILGALGWLLAIVGL